MKTYTITFMAYGTLTIPASSVEEARALFKEFYQEDAIRELAMNKIEVTDIQKETNETVEPEIGNADNDVHNADKINCDVSADADSGEHNTQSIL